MATTKSGKTSKAASTSGEQENFTADERAAMKERAKEMRSASRRSAKPTAAEGDAEILAKIAEMPAPDQELATRVHEIIRAAAPDLMPTTWYGMPAYAKDGKALVFFQPASKFKARYSTLGFNDKAALDDGVMWPTSYALTDLTPAAEKQIAELVKQAAG